MRDQLPERFGLFELVDAAAQRVFGALLGGQGRGLVQILGAQRGVREHGDLVGLDFERTATDEEMLLGAIRRLHAHFAGLEQRQQRRVARRNAQFALRCPARTPWSPRPRRFLPRR